MQEQLGRLSSPDKIENIEEQTRKASCEGQWVFYCHQIEAAINLALSKHKRVVVVTEPYISDRHIEQQQALASMLKQKFPGSPMVLHVNLGRSLDVRNGALAYDGMHLTVAGNERIADSLVQPLLGVLRP